MSIYYLNNNKGPHGAARARTRTYTRVQSRTAAYGWPAAARPQTREVARHYSGTMRYDPRLFNTI